MSTGEPCNCDQSIELSKEVQRHCATIDDMKKDIQFLLEEINLEKSWQDPIRLNQLREKYND